MRQLCRILAATLIICSAALADETADIAAARAVFDQNINAIRQRDRDKYLSLYLHDTRLVRGGPDGFTTGFEEHAKQAGVALARRDRGERRSPDLASAGTRLWNVSLSRPLRRRRALRHLGASLHEDAGRLEDRRHRRDRRTARNAGASARDHRRDAHRRTRRRAGPEREHHHPRRQDRLRRQVRSARGHRRRRWTRLVGDARPHRRARALLADGLGGWAAGRARCARHASVLRRRGGSERAPGALHSAYLCSGVTSVFDVGGYAWTLDFTTRSRTTRACRTSSPRVRCCRRSITG